MNRYIYSTKLDPKEDYGWRTAMITGKVRGYPKYQVLGEVARKKFEATINVDDFDMDVIVTTTPYMILRGEPRQRQFEPIPMECSILGESRNARGSNDGTLYYTPEFEAEAKVEYSRLSAKQSERMDDFYSTYFS